MFSEAEREAVRARAFLDDLGRHDRALADRLAEPLFAIISESRESDRRKEGYVT